MYFNSLTDPIPPMRYDVQRIPVQQNGHSLIYFYDQMGYSTSDFAIPSDAEAILSLINGIHSIEDILKFSSEEVTADQVLEYIQFLDEHKLLDSEYFRSEKERMELEYESSGIHESNTAGSSYPADPEQLKAFLDEAFKSHELSEPVSDAKALYAPHIDTRIGLSSYVKAFSAIRDLKPKKVILLATSHYSGLYPEVYQDKPFILSQKNFRMPNGTSASDPEMIKIIREVSDDKGDLLGLSFQDRAHRMEHSIELHLLFLNHIWSHDFHLLPILVGGMDELFYHPESHRMEQLETFSSLLRKLDDKDTFFLISGDLSHIGRKFGDEQPATSMFEEVEENDQQFLTISEQGDPVRLVQFMKREFDPYRICGFPPLLSLLNTFPGIPGSTLSYDLWDEKERESAVSFGSILYQNTDHSGSTS